VIRITMGLYVINCCVTRIVIRMDYVIMGHVIVDLVIVE